MRWQVTRCLAEGVSLDDRKLTTGHVQLYQRRDSTLAESGSPFNRNPFNLNGLNIQSS